MEIGSPLFPHSLSIFTAHFLHLRRENQPNSLNAVLRLANVSKRTAIRVFDSMEEVSVSVGKDQLVTVSSAPDTEWPFEFHGSLSSFIDFFCHFQPRVLALADQSFPPFGEPLRREALEVRCGQHFCDRKAVSTVVRQLLGKCAPDLTSVQLNPAYLSAFERTPPTFVPSLNLDELTLDMRELSCVNGFLGHHRARRVNLLLDAFIHAPYGFARSLGSRRSALSRSLQHLHVDIRTRMNTFLQETGRGLDEAVCLLKHAQGVDLKRLSVRLEIEHNRKVSHNFTNWLYSDLLTEMQRIPNHQLDVHLDVLLRLDMEPAGWSQQKVALTHAQRFDRFARSQQLMEPQHGLVTYSGRLDNFRLELAVENTRVTCFRSH